MNLVLTEDTDLRHTSNGGRVEHNGPAQPRIPRGPDAVFTGNRKSNNRDRDNRGHSAPHACPLYGLSQLCRFGMSRGECERRDLNAVAGTERRALT